MVGVRKLLVEVAAGSVWVVAERIRELMVSEPQGERVLLIAQLVVAA